MAHTIFFSLLKALARCGLSEQEADQGQRLLHLQEEAQEKKVATLIVIVISELIKIIILNTVDLIFLLVAKVSNCS